MTKRTITALALAFALGAFAAPSGAQSTASRSFDVDITLYPPGTILPPVPPPGGGGGTPPGATGDLCVSQSLSDATGATVRVVCTTGQFVSIEADQSQPYSLGVHGGAYRFYFANGMPASLQFVGHGSPWVGPGTVTSLRVNYLEGLDGIIEMQVGF